MRPIIGCALLLAALASAACHTMRPVTFDQLNAIKPAQAWVTGGDQKVILVSGPQLLGDTLVGYVNGKYEEMPTAQFKQVRVQRPATAKTALLVAALTVGFGAFAYVLAGGGATDKSDDSCTERPESPMCQAM